MVNLSMSGTVEEVEKFIGEEDDSIDDDFFLRKEEGEREKCEFKR